MSQRRPNEPSKPSLDEQLDMPDEVLDIYADNLNIGTGLYSSTLYFAELREGKKPLLKARIKVSPQMLKSLSLLSAKHVRDLEQAVGPIGLPNDLLHSWGLEDEIK